MTEARWGRYQNDIQSKIDEAKKSELLERILKKDASLWSARAEVKKEILQRLGWLDAATKSKTRLEEINEFVSEIKKEGFRHVVLLGMGGSSLAPEVYQKLFQPKEGYLSLTILDSTDPERVRDVEESIGLVKTLFILSSKSGTTVEPRTLFKYFRNVQSRKYKEPEKLFAAITDPGTNLARSAGKGDFRKVFLSDPNVGGRYSALTLFGLVPAALMGVDIRSLLDEAEVFAEALKNSRSPQAQSVLELGIAMAILAEQGRDKLTFVAPNGLESFGDWAEQLIAESTGKENKGIAPIVRETLAETSEYASDRFFVHLSQNGVLDADVPKMDALSRAGHPILFLRMKDKNSLGAEYLRWEMATAVAGSLLKINPFDQPNVQEAKERTMALLSATIQGKKMPIMMGYMTQGPFKGAAGKIFGKSRPADHWNSFWRSLKPNDAIHLLTFLPDRTPIRNLLEKLRRDLRKKTKHAVTLGFGPRYLHSTGQLHKGGPDRGIYLILMTTYGMPIEIPSENFTFDDLEKAQALGDFQALDDKGRRVFLIQLDLLSEQNITMFSEMVLTELSKIERTKKQRI